MTLADFAPSLFAAIASDTIARDIDSLVGAYVSGGEGEDYDEGQIIDVAGYNDELFRISWRSGIKTSETVAHVVELDFHRRCPWA